PARLLDRDLPNHLAAEVEGRHPLEQLGAAPQHADARRAAQLVRGEGEGVASEPLDVDTPVRRGLRSVDDHDRALLVRPSSKLLDRIDRPESVRDEVRGDDLDVTLPRDRAERVEL